MLVFRGVFTTKINHQQGLLNFFGGTEAILTNDLPDPEVGNGLKVGGSRCEFDPLKNIIGGTMVLGNICQVYGDILCKKSKTTQDKQTLFHRQYPSYVHVFFHDLMNGPFFSTIR